MTTVRERRPSAATVRSSVTCSDARPGPAAASRGAATASLADGGRTRGPGPTPGSPLVTVSPRSQGARRFGAADRQSSPSRAGLAKYDADTGARLRPPFVIRDELLLSLRAALAEAGFDEPAGGVALDPPRQREHGDWTTNVALQVAKSAGMPPRD